MHVVLEVNWGYGSFHISWQLSQSTNKLVASFCVLRGLKTGLQVIFKGLVKKEKKKKQLSYAL